MNIEERKGEVLKMKQKDSYKFSNGTSKIFNIAGIFGFPK